MAVDLEKQIQILKSHPVFNEVVRNIGAGHRINTIVVLLQNGSWLELEFTETLSGKTRVGYWDIPKPDASTQMLLDYLQSEHTRN